jgi:serine/threonine-protein kinase
MLPVLLPAYRQAELQQRPYGKAVFQDETKYYEVFQYSEGETLRDLLLKNPQPWYQHAAWMTISLADVIAFLHIQANKLHLNLNPESILIRYDKQRIPRLTLLDLGTLSDPQAVDTTWIQQYNLPAYTAPELLSPNGAIGHNADVYGLGLIFYEMLAGHSAYDYRLHRASELRQVIAQTSPAPLNRTDLSDEIHQIVVQAIDKAPSHRQQDVRAFAKMLRVKFGEVPAEKKRRVDRRIFAVVVFVGLAVVIAIMLAALLG